MPFSKNISEPNMASQGVTDIKNGYIFERIEVLKVLLKC